MKPVNYVIDLKEPFFSTSTHPKYFGQELKEFLKYHSVQLEYAGYELLSVTTEGFDVYIQGLGRDRTENLRYDLEGFQNVRDFWSEKEKYDESVYLAPSQEQLKRAVDALHFAHIHFCSALPIVSGLDSESLNDYMERGISNTFAHQSSKSLLKGEFHLEDTREERSKALKHWSEKVKSQKSEESFAQLILAFDEVLKDLLIDFNNAVSPREARKMAASHAKKNSSKLTIHLTKFLDLCLEEDLPESRVNQLIAEAGLKLPATSIHNWMHKRKKARLGDFDISQDKTSEEALKKIEEGVNKVRNSEVFLKLNNS
ncbi:hypothetical protein THMIRHAS_04930 [Thiosulfatimonas sediminis]|uniref:Uncharacterized protein n=2 Tax=Thiosulfatimonas sediminis TaxID=2675054 RepID=A0A6F8PT07_9GAMM|nr:hypothetical protein THMIRHAS_04930 [Thiosulfatimonas sediminis]